MIAPGSEKATDLGSKRQAAEIEGEESVKDSKKMKTEEGDKSGEKEVTLKKLEKEEDKEEKKDTVEGEEAKDDNDDEEFDGQNVDEEDEKVSLDPESDHGEEEEFDPVAYKKFCEEEAKKAEGKKED